MSKTDPKTIINSAAGCIVPLDPTRPARLVSRHDLPTTVQRFNIYAYDTGNPAPWASLTTPLRKPANTSTMSFTEWQSHAAALLSECKERKQ